MLTILSACIFLGLPGLSVASGGYIYGAGPDYDEYGNFVGTTTATTTTTSKPTTTPSPIPSIIEDFRDEMTSIKTDLAMLKTASTPSILMNKLLILTNVKLVASCEDLAQVGAVNPGYFKIEKNGVQSTVYCNFSKNFR